MFEFDRNIPKHERKILKVVYKDFFKDSPVAIKMRLEGQAIKNNDYVLGLRAGPSIELSNLFHEMGHLAEREIEKLILKPNYGWGYQYGKPQYIFGRIIEEAQTDQAIRREARCWAYQYSLMKHYGIEEELFNIVKSAVFIDCFYLFEYEQIKDLPYEDKERTRIELLANYVQSLHENDYCFENFVVAWNQRMEVLSYAKNKSA